MKEELKERFAQTLNYYLEILITKKNKKIRVEYPE